MELNWRIIYQASQMYLYRPVQPIFTSNASPQNLSIWDYVPSQFTGYLEGNVRYYRSSYSRVLSSFTRLWNLVLILPCVMILCMAKSITRTHPLLIHWTTFKHLICFKPCILKGSLFHKFSEDKSEFNAFNKVGKHDYETFLLNRAKELLPGKYDTLNIGK